MSDFTGNLPELQTALAEGIALGVFPRQHCSEAGQALTLLEALAGPRSYTTTRAAYKRTLDTVLYDFGTSARTERVTKYQSALSTAMVEAFYAAFWRGVVDGGGTATTEDSEAQDWLNARTNSELGYIKEMFQALKALRNAVWDKEATVGDVKAFVEQRKANYLASLDGVYNEGKMRAKGSVMLTCVGEDGEESCVDCQSRKGKRYSAKKWLKIGYPPSRDFECHGYHCRHYLQTDDGTPWTSA